MEKMIILGLGNDGYRYYYTIKKEKEIVGTMDKLLSELGFEGELYYDCEDVLTEKRKEFCSGFKNKEFDVDLFVGIKRLILVIRTRKRAKLLKLIEKYCEMLKLKKVKKKK